MREFSNILKMTEMLCILGLLNACSPGFQNKNLLLLPSSPSSQIINGIDLEDGAVPAQSSVLLVNPVSEMICTAILLNESFALTAAHCLDLENPGNHYIFFGTRPTNTAPRRQVVAARASRYWGAQDPNAKNSGDIAIIKFFESGPLPEGFRAANFLKDASLLKAGQKTLVLGYGVTSPNSFVGVGQLRAAAMPILDVQYSATEILLDQTKGSRVCHGDSGGPAFLRIQNTYYLWGLAARGVGNEDEPCSSAVAFTNVLMYSTWIQRVLNKL